MALLNIDPYITAERLKELFHRETGLSLQIKYENKAQDDSTLLGYLGMRIFNLDNKPEPNEVNSNFLPFDYNMPVSTLKHIMIPRIVFDLDVLHDDGIIPDNARLSEFIHDDIKYRSINYKPETASRINSLNEKLIRIEEDIYTRWCSLKNTLDIKLRNTEHWLNDYEIELSIDYYIDSSDPLYDKNSENLLITMSRSLGKESWHSMINDGRHHRFNIIPSGMKSPVCYLLHDLMEHYHLDSFDIQRIGRIWVDINTCHRHCYEITGYSDCTAGKPETGKLFRITKVPYNSLSFKNFYVSPENELPYNAAEKVIKSSPVEMNPFVLYGSTGTGKTHLLNAIMIKYLEHDPRLKIFYTTASEFTSEFINSIMKNTQREFSKKYQALDVLIIDDFEFFEKKEETQNEFYRIMCALFFEKKKVIISSGKNPSKLLTISDRLKSRLRQGYITQLKYPDYESRLSFLSSGIFHSDLELTDEIKQIIAQNINSFGELKNFIKNLKIMHDIGVVLSKEQIDIEIRNYIQHES